MEKFREVRSLEAIALNLRALCLEPKIENGRLKILPASGKEVLSWSHGKVTKPETLNYRTYKPEKGGIFCESIFGPELDWECACGKHKGMKYKGTVCDRCKVEITTSLVRNERMGHIELAAPVVHPYFKEYLESLLNISCFDLKDTIYCKKDGKGVEGLEKRLKKDGKPNWMILKNIPVSPPGLRPLILLESGNFATADSNDLYRRLININNRIKQLKKLNAPEVIIRNEQRMLQQAVECLYWNSASARQVVGENGRLLVSLTDELKGRLNNFWRKYCDYSGRAVVVPDPELKQNECGLPLRVVSELYKPLIIYNLKNSGVAETIKGAKKIIEHNYSALVEANWPEIEKSVRKAGSLFVKKPGINSLENLARKTARETTKAILPDFRKVVGSYIQAVSSRPLIVTYGAKATALWPKITGKEIEAASIHPDVCKKLDLKMAGERVSYHLPLSEKAVQEARSLVGKVVEGTGQVESAFSSLVAEDSIKPLIAAVVEQKALLLSKLERYLIS